MAPAGAIRSRARRVRSAAVFVGRYLTATWRPYPDVVIIGAQRGGTTSLYSWLTAQPGVAPARKKEPHYFDYHYHRGPRWYRAHFALRRHGRVVCTSDPFMLFHPLAPGRAARDLPAHVKFVVLLRDPTDRAISQYWLWQRQGKWEDQPLERAIELERARLGPHEERFRHGERSHAHIAHSYMARGEYASQLRRWFDAVGRHRVLVVESERLFRDPVVADQVLEWIGLPPSAVPFPVSNSAPRLVEASPDLLDRMDAHFAPHNAALRAMLGEDLWGGGLVDARPPRSDRPSGRSGEPPGCW